MVELKDLIVVPNIAERLRRPTKTDKVLGPRKYSWCEFHEAFGHHIDNFLSLGYQLDEQVRNGFLKDYVAEPATIAALPGPTEEQAHEMPVLGEVHTIVGGFPAEDPPPPSERNTRGGSTRLKKGSQVNRGNRTSCSRGGISETWCRTTMMPWSFQLSRRAARCIGFLSTKEALQMSCFGRHLKSCGYLLTF